MSILRGQVYYIHKFENQGNETSSGRPAIIVSNNKNNYASGVVSIVYLTTQPKKDLPTHVTIRSTLKESIALCEQVHSVDIDKVGRYLATCTEQEMQMIDIALSISLGLSSPPSKNNIGEGRPPENYVPFKESVPKESMIESERKLIKAETELNTYKTLYNNMLERMVSSK